MNDTARKALLAELYKLSPIAQEAVRELLTAYDERRELLAAEQFLAELLDVPQI